VQSYFNDLAAYAAGKLKGGEAFTAYLSGEDSDFCRLSGAKVRQAGKVKQSLLSFKLINEKAETSAEASLGLAGSAEEDKRRLDWALSTLREQITALPKDPYLLYATDVRSSEKRHKSELPEARSAIDAVTQKAAGLDLVGIYASGGVYRGFANSFGQRNWYETHSFNFDWSVYLHADKAVKTGYAGFKWDDGAFAQKLEGAREQLSVLGKTPKELKPGRYRVYLAPQALTEVTDMLAWGGFSLKAHKTKQTPLLKMVEAGQKMSTKVSMRENTAGGISPDFNALGFTKPSSVPLIESGAYAGCLVSPRSAKEYKVETNGAGDGEQPQSFELLPGQVQNARVAAELGEGILVNNLWYLNYSDRPACRVTGMTRFASFWVAGGKIVQPLSVMRFDESLLKVFGENLVGLTAERELILSAGTYGQRSTSSAHLPGALVDDFSFTL
jgi:predicted Zn-dependent protease